MRCKCYIVIGQEEPAWFEPDPPPSSKVHIEGVYSSQQVALMACVNAQIRELATYTAYNVTLPSELESSTASLQQWQDYADKLRKDLQQTSNLVVYRVVESNMNTDVI